MPPFLITIGLTTYNAANSVGKAIQSALSQTLGPIEIVVVDDASTDETPKILEQLAEKYKEIRFFTNKENSGVAISRNRILKEAQGEFVVFFDDDDESLPQRIAEQYQRIVSYEKKFANGAPVICHTARRVIYPNNKELIEPTMGVIKDKQAPFGPAVAERILLGTPLEDGYGSCATCSQMARLSTYRLLDGFDPSLRRGEDTDFNIRLALAGGHFVGIEKPLVVQAMTKTSDKSLRDEYYYWRLILEKHRSIMESKGQFEFSIAWLDMKQSWLERKRLTFVLNLLKLFMKNPLLTLRRLYLALPNIGLNNQFSRFHFSKTE